MAYIYKIQNKINGKVYIGSANNYKTRWYQHRYNLKINDHDNKYLQNAWNKYGEENFEFSIIEENIDVDKKYEREQYYLDELQPFPPIGYNISKKAKGGNSGEDSSMSKYTYEQIYDVKKLLSQGMRICDICKLTNVSNGVIWNIKVFRSWVECAEEFNEEIFNLPSVKKIGINEVTDEQLEEAILLLDNGLSKKEVNEKLNFNRNVLGRTFTVYKAKKKGKKIKQCQICGKELILKSNNSNRKYCKKCSVQVNKIKSKESRRKNKTNNNN